MTTLLIILTAIIAGLQIDDLKAKPFKRKPWLTFLLLIIATLITYFVEAKKDSDAITDKKNNDSLADLRTSKSNKIIIDGIGQAIGKYGLKYDSAKKEIDTLRQLLKDSANRKITIIQGDNPTVMFNLQDGIKLDYIRNDTLRFYINISSYSAASLINNATVYLMYSNYKDKNIFQDLKFLEKELFFTKIIVLPKDGNQSRGFAIKGVDSIKSLIILIRGNFTNNIGEHMQQLNEIGVLDIETGKFYNLAFPYDDEIRKFLKDKGVL